MAGAVTGWAWRTPLGSSVDDVVRRLLAGERAIQPNRLFNAETFACTVAATMAVAPAPSRHQRFLRRMGLFALEVALEAMSHARTEVAAERLGLYFGYGGLRAHLGDLLPALEHQRLDGEDSWARGFRLLHPFWMLQHLSNNAHALAAMELGARGEGVTFGGANAGAQALGAALRALEVGAVDVAVVVGQDTLVEPETVVELAAHGAATRRPHHQIVAPYDRDCDGFVPGEAAAALVLQRPGDAKVRVLAHVAALDGADGSDSAPAGALLGRLATRLAEGGEPVDGAGRGTPRLDLEERTALAQVIGANAPLCCTLSAMGQIGAAAPLVQTIALAELLRHQVLAPVAGLGNVADGPLRAIIRGEATSARAALGVSTGAPGLAGLVRVERP